MATQSREAKTVESGASHGVLSPLNTAIDALNSPDGPCPDWVEHSADHFKLLPSSLLIASPRSAAYIGIKRPRSDSLTDDQPNENLCEPLRKVLRAKEQISRRIGSLLQKANRDMVLWSMLALTDHVKL